MKTKRRYLRSPVRARRASTGSMALGLLGQAIDQRRARRSQCIQVRATRGVHDRIDKVFDHAGGSLRFVGSSHRALSCILTRQPCSANSILTGCIRCAGCNKQTTLRSFKWNFSCLTQGYLQTFPIVKRKAASQPKGSPSLAPATRSRQTSSETIRISGMSLAIRSFDGLSLIRLAYRDLSRSADDCRVGVRDRFRSKGCRLSWPDYP